MELPVPVEQARSPTASGHRPSPSRPDAVPWLIHNGARVLLGDGGAALGRETDNDVVLTGAGASRHHARIERADGRWFVADLSSTNGTFLNGERLLGEARWLESGDAIAVGGETLRFLLESTGGAMTNVVASPIPVGDRVTIGRSDSSDIRLAGPTVSGLHAEIVRTGDRVEVIDHGSRFGTRVDGALVKRAELVPGTEIGVGSTRFVYDGANLIPRAEEGALRLEADGLGFAVRGTTLLDGVTLSVAPGELVAVVGESGSGKSTLLKLLAGITRPTAGTILLSGDDVSSRLSDIGYLPQDEIVHPRLTITESLGYSARLRLPSDSTREEIVEAVRSALVAVSLDHAGDQPVGVLSGGQRKRVGLATELLCRPGILLLDEPTTGLDVGLERQMMELFRSLAGVGSHAVVVVTHATHSLNLVDKLVVMGRGGHLCFAGTPAEALRFFGVESYEGIYVALQQRPAPEWRKEFDEQHERPAPAEPPAQRAPSPRRASFLTQTVTLSARYAKVFFRDRLNLMIMLAQTPVLGIFLLLLFRHHVFGVAKGGPLVATQLVFLLVMITIWLGALDASREIVKEKAIFGRERAMGVTIPAYLLSKVVVLFALVLVQATILLGLTAILRPFHEGFGTYLEVFGILAVTGFAAIGMGLLVSSVAGNEDQATALAPVAMTMQLLVGGGIVTVKSMTFVMKAVSTTSFGRWAFQGIGTQLHMNARFAANGISPAQNQYGASFFRLGIGETYALLVGFTLLFFAAISGILARRKPG